MRVIYRGAESVLYVNRWEGQQVLIKERLRKGYRIPQIDETIRKSRTRREAKLLAEARRWGVPTPKVFEIDEKAHKIIMEYVRGDRLKELLATADPKTVRKLCLEVGRLIGRLHAHGIIHGDLTTSNMIRAGGQIYFIDFGLGTFSHRLEDQGVDLNLLREALRATHFNIMRLCWRAIITGYRQEYAHADQALTKADEIERRARYMVRVQDL